MRRDDLPGGTREPAEILPTGVPARPRAAAAPAADAEATRKRRSVRAAAAVLAAMTLEEEEPAEDGAAPAVEEPARPDGEPLS